METEEEEIGWDSVEGHRWRKKWVGSWKVSRNGTRRERRRGCLAAGGTKVHDTNGKCPLSGCRVWWEKGLLESEAGKVGWNQVRFNPLGQSSRAWVAPRKKGIMIRTMYSQVKVDGAWKVDGWLGGETRDGRVTSWKAGFCEWLP